MELAHAETPFVLLDDARSDGASPSRLYRHPAEIVTATAPGALGEAMAALSRPGHWAGFIAYDAGHALEPRLAPLRRDPGLPLLWFARFEECRELHAGEVAALLPPAEGGWAGTPAPRVARGYYAAGFATVQERIRAGDIYQANLTFPCDVSLAGHPLAVYAGLRARARAGYGGVVWTGAHWLLSLSPELFFALKDAKITTKPMKGTAVRGASPAEDAAAAHALLADPKQRAENLMIVDLLRNDLSRVAEAGSVEVPQLFAIETYPTVHQMTSTVTARLRAGLGVADILAAIFPCGSITGAPKIRAMEVIGEVEPEPRGIYTGAIGRIDANGDAAFNVAIRTLHLRNGAGRATLGLGSGVVADSEMGLEWAECIAKGAFVADPRRFDLIETMRFEPESGIAHLERHLERIKDSARALDFAFDRHNARNALQAATFRLHAPARVRLMAGRGGTTAIEIGRLPKSLRSPVPVPPVPLPVNPDDFRLRHKTSDRAFYDDARKQSGAFEVVFVRADGFLTEGSFTNLFVKRDGGLLTPPLARGLLPGVLRAELLESGKAQEADLTERDLAEGFLIGNALRGLIPARLA